jgi:hypothetical protein
VLLTKPLLQDRHVKAKAAGALQVNYCLFKSMCFICP